MSAPDYRKLSFDLSVARDRGQIIDPGVGYDAVTIVEIPAGASVELHFGTNKDGVPIFGIGAGWDVSGMRDGCPVPADEGLFLTNPAGAGTFTIIVSFAGLIPSGAA